eukprot:g48121.t1
MEIGNKPQQVSWVVVVYCTHYNIVQQNGLQIDEAEASEEEEEKDEEEEADVSLSANETDGNGEAVNDRAAGGMAMLSAMMLWRIQSSPDGSWYRIDFHMVFQ